MTEPNKSCYERFNRKGVPVNKERYFINNDTIESFNNSELEAKLGRYTDPEVVEWHMPAWMIILIFCLMVAAVSIGLGVGLAAWECL